MRRGATQRCRGDDSRPGSRRRDGGSRRGQHAPKREHEEHGSSGNRKYRRTILGPAENECQRRSGERVVAAAAAVALAALAGGSKRRGAPATNPPGGRPRRATTSGGTCSSGGPQTGADSAGGANASGHAPADGRGRAGRALRPRRAIRAVARIPWHAVWQMRAHCLPAHVDRQCTRCPCSPSLRRACTGAGSRGEYSPRGSACCQNHAPWAARTRTNVG